MTDPNLKITESALSHLSPFSESKQEDDLARWSSSNHPALVQGLDRVMTAIQLAQKNQKTMLQRMPSQANPAKETKVIFDALVKFGRILDAAISLAKKQSK